MTSLSHLPDLGLIKGARMRRRTPPPNLGSVMASSIPMRKLPLDARHMLTALAISVVAFFGATSSSLAADWVVGSGTVDPPFGARLAIGTSYSSMVRAWGPPSQPAEDIPIAVWPKGLEVTLTRAPAGAAVKFLVSSSRWRTTSGARTGMTTSALQRIYGSRLVAVEDQRGLLGVSRHWMVLARGKAIGFVMRSPDRVMWILTGRLSTVRSELAFAGPI